MSAPEINAMLYYVKGSHVGATWQDGEATYLEWGSGGSTSTYGTAAGTAYSIEHVTEWCVNVRDWPEMRCLNSSGRWNLMCHDPGLPLGAWGYPVINGTGKMRRFRDSMRHYVQGPRFFAPETYDVVLIDGRQRNACAWSIVPYLRADSIVAWHDFDAGSWNRVVEGVGKRASDVEQDPADIFHHRQYWKAASRLFRPIVRVDTLAFFKINPRVYAQLSLMTRRRRRRST
jgi:hypothetical protein